MKCSLIVANTSIAASYRTAQHCSGDYYDLITMADGRLGALVADVSGKGAAAALLMVALRTILHEMDWSQARGPAEVLDYADSRLTAMDLMERGFFVTAFACTLDPRSGVLTYSSAGHNPPRWLRRRQREVVPLDEARSFPLGVLDEPSKHTEETILLGRGDVTLLYTDGLTEARSPNGEFFGVGRIDDALRSLPKGATAATTVEAITSAVSAFSVADPPLDDQTLLALARLPRTPSKRKEVSSNERLVTASRTDGPTAGGQ